MRFKIFLPIFIAGEAVGKPCKVPYQKGGFKVEGLPDQLIFKKPYHYGALQRRNIMLAEKTIKFILESEEYGSIPVADEPVRQLLTKIAGANAAECSLRRESPQKIEESDVEVINLELSEEEKILLYSRCKPNFTEDAWVAVGKNMKHSQEEKPLILPVYTEAEERFWLFYAITKPTQIQQTGPLTKITGYWLDLRPTEGYKVLDSEQVTLLGKNIIRTMHGPMYFALTETLGQTSYNLPLGNRQAIENALGLLS